MADVSSYTPSANYFEQYTDTSLGKQTPVPAVQQSTSAEMVQQRGIDSDGETKDTSIEMKTTQVVPTSTQPNMPKTVDVGSDAFLVDTYRNGGGTGEMTAPRTLGEPDQETLSYITLYATGAGAGKDLISAYSRFFLQSVAEGDNEKYQVVETFTGYYAFFYGRRPPIYRFSGLLLADDNYRWNNDFKFAYDNYFRGTKAVEYQAQVMLYYDARVVTGFPLSLNMQQGADIAKGVPFSMDMLIVDHTPTKFSVDIADLLSKKSQELATRADALRNTAAYLKQGASGASILAAGQALNGIRATSTVENIATLPTSLAKFSGASLA